jgi:protein-S-isoprenylcysteine O-methyltransferase Ste14
MRPDEPQAKREFSLGNLFTDLTRELSTLVRQEAQLIKAEVSEKVTDAKAGAGEMLAGGAVLLVGFLILMLALVAGVNQMLGTTGIDQPWLAPLIVGLLLSIVGAVILLWGRQNLSSGATAPHRSAESIRRDTEVLKEQLKH